METLIQRPSRKLFFYYINLGIPLSLMCISVYMKSDIPLFILFSISIASQIITFSITDNYIGNTIITISCFSFYIALCLFYSHVSPGKEGSQIINAISVMGYIKVLSFYSISSITAKFIQLMFFKNSKLIRLNLFFNICVLLSITMLILSHSVAYVMLSFFGKVLGASGIMFPIVFALSDIITERFGNDHNTALIWSMIINQILFLCGMLLLMYVFHDTSMSVFYTRFLWQVFAATPSIIGALWLGGSIISKLRIYRLRFVWRIILSTIIAKTILSIINYSILFLHFLGAEKTLRIIINMSLFKIAFGLALLPIVILAVNISRKLTKKPFKIEDKYNPIDMRIYSHENNY